MAGPVTIDQPPDLTVVLDNTTDVTCNGGNDGMAGITPGGGVGGYTYSWDGQTSGLISTDEDPTNLVADTYDLTLFDANGCSKTFISFATIDEPAPFGIIVDGTTDVSCSGGNDGTASITRPAEEHLPIPFHGAVPCRDIRPSDEDPVNMPADDYSLTITDSRGCNLLYPDSCSPFLNRLRLIGCINGTTDVTCFGGNDGTASITVSGGTSPYTFKLDR